MRISIGILLVVILVSGCINTRPPLDIRHASLDGKTRVDLTDAEISVLRAAWSSSSNVLSAISQLEPEDFRWVQDYMALTEQRRNNCSSLQLLKITLLPRNNAISLDGGYMRVQYYHEKWHVRSCGVDRTYEIHGDIHTPIFSEER